MELTDEWIIGFTEGEGSFTSRCHKLRTDGKDARYPIFTISQKTKEILEEIQKRFNCGFLRKYHKKNCKGDGIWYIWTVSDKKGVEKMRDFFNGKLKIPYRINQFEKWKSYFSNENRRTRPKTDIWKQNASISQRKAYKSGRKKPVMYWLGKKRPDQSERMKGNKIRLDI